MFVLLVNGQSDHHPGMQERKFAEDRPVTVAQETVFVGRNPVGHVYSEFFSRGVLVADVETHPGSVTDPGTVEVTTPT